MLALHYEARRTEPQTTMLSASKRSPDHNRGHLGPHQQATVLALQPAATTPPDAARAARARPATKPQTAYSKASNQPRIKPRAAENAASARPHALVAARAGGLRADASRGAFETYA